MGGFLNPNICIRQILPLQDIQRFHQIFNGHLMKFDMVVTLSFNSSTVTMLGSYIFQLLHITLNQIWSLAYLNHHSQTDTKFTGLPSL